LDKEITRLQQDQARAAGKLANPSFVDKAPEAVVQKERDKIVEVREAIAKLQEQREKIAEL
jgi:valyl-tRNA synthetase